MNTHTRLPVLITCCYVNKHRQKKITTTGGGGGTKLFKKNFLTFELMVHGNKLQILHGRNMRIFTPLFHLSMHEQCYTGFSYICIYMYQD